MTHLVQSVGKVAKPGHERAIMINFEVYILLIVNKQLLDEVFGISGIIKVEVTVISRSRRLRLITLTETLIIPDIAKTESNNDFIIHCFTSKQNNGKQFQHLCPSRLPASERFFP